MITFTWTLVGSSTASGEFSISKDSRLLVYGGQVVCRESVLAYIPLLRAGDALHIGDTTMFVQAHDQTTRNFGWRPTLGVALGPDETTTTPPGGGGGPPLPPLEQNWAYGPTNANVTVSYFGSRVQASSTAPGVVFYRWALGIAGGSGSKVYWEFVTTGAITNTFGGFGVGPCTVDTGSRPGVGDNPGCLLYWENKAASVWCDGIEYEIDDPSDPTRIGVGVEIVSDELCHVNFYSAGVQLNAEPFAMILEGAIVVPVLCTLNAEAVFTLADQI